ncbi:MAG: hypothetical protein Q8S31_05060 [Alphaproteobacteria bacterium]|nr:hypothetical protein [Alphaproteobacteria bacterium]
MKKLFFLMILTTNIVNATLIHTIETPSTNAMMQPIVYSTFIHHDPSKIQLLKEQFPSPQLPISFEAFPEYWDANFIKVGTSNSEVINDSSEKLGLSTEGIIDCVGITFWEPEFKTSAIYHYSVMNRYEDLEKYFLPKLIEKQKDISKFKVYLTSCYYSPNLYTIKKFLDDYGFNIEGIYIDNKEIDRSDFLNTYYYLENYPSVDLDKVPGDHKAKAILLLKEDGTIRIKED